MFSILLRVVEGTGNAMFYTASYTLLTHLYIERKGMIVVGGIILHQLLKQLFEIDPFTLRLSQLENISTSLRCHGENTLKIITRVLLRSSTSKWGYRLCSIDVEWQGLVSVVSPSN